MCNQTAHFSIISIRNIGRNGGTPFISPIGFHLCHERSYQKKRIITQTPRANQSRKARPGTSESRSTRHMARAKMNNILNFKDRGRKIIWKKWAEWMTLNYVIEVGWWIFCLRLRKMVPPLMWCFKKCLWQILFKITLKVLWISSVFYDLESLNKGSNEHIQ